MNTIPERLRALRDLMKESGVDVYLIPTSDFHESEYVGDHFKARRYMTGFTGSAGVAVVTMTEAGLWTDGRYFIQAAAQLEGSGVTLYRMGEEGVPTVEEFIQDQLPEGGCLGFDGRVVNRNLGLKLEKAVNSHGGKLSVAEDLVGRIWTDRPSLPAEPVFILEERYSGKSMEDKVDEVRKAMEEEGAQAHILTSLDDIAWLLNIRGGDIPNFPIVLSYVVLTPEKLFLFINPATLSEKVRAYLEGNDVTLMPYDGIYGFVKDLKAKKVLLDGAKVNTAICSSLPEGTEIISKPNPTLLMKAIKNPVELENLRRAHIKDGVAMVKFLYWLKSNIGKKEITEISASDYLEACRREQEGNLGLSFNTISAYNANAAMMHYSATPESNAVLKPEGFLLVDSGGHYYEGSTDITRTIVLGPVPQEWKLHFTTVLRSMLTLANARFLYGCCGMNLDILSRGPLWEMGLDYKCGTGHGIGYLLNVHESPNGFRWKIVPERNDSAPLEEGMVTTDEPGVYIEGSHGIRTENELVCRKAEKNEYGQFMEFENITYCPIDLDAVDVQYLSDRELKMLNDYHAMVYEKLQGRLNEEERAWLKENTRPLSR